VFVLIIMDHAQGRAFHHHLARAIMHLNHLAGLLPFSPCLRHNSAWNVQHQRASTRLFPCLLHHIHPRWCHMEASLHR
jgi:hypothetical protein